MWHELQVIFKISKLSKYFGGPHVLNIIFLILEYKLLTY